MGMQVAWLCLASAAAALGVRLVAPILPTITEDFGLDPATADMIFTRWKTAIALPCGIGVAYYSGMRADSARTKHLVLSLLGLAHLALFATALAQTALEFIGARIAYAAADAGLRTALPVLVTHHLQTHNFSLGIAAVLLSHGVGELLGELSMLLARPGAEMWRACFVTTAVIGLVCTGALARWLTEIARVEILSPCPDSARLCTMRNTFLLAAGFFSTMPTVANGLLLAAVGEQQRLQQRAAWTEDDTIGQVLAFGFLRGFF